MVEVTVTQIVCPRCSRECRSLCSTELKNGKKLNKIKKG